MWAIIIVILASAATTLAMYALNAVAFLKVAMFTTSVFIAATIALANLRKLDTSPNLWGFGALSEHDLILLDGGCSGHITGNKGLLTNIFGTFPVVVRGANGVSVSGTAGTLAMIDVVMQVVQGAPTLLSQSGMRRDYEIQLVDNAEMYILRSK